MNVRRSLAARIFRPGSALTESAELTHNGTITDIQVVTAPATDALERLVLPEGLRVIEARSFWTKAEVSGPDPETGADSDLIRYHGNLFRVVNIENWGGDFYEVIGVRPTGATI